ncbi:MAG: DMT family transporter [Planctomycetia bacterium]|nr:DMT family transporter [Planctomycetia bacterium]
MALSPLLFREQLTINKTMGFIAVVIGVVLINGNAFDSHVDLFGIACGLLSAVMYAFMVICNKKATGTAGLENATLQLTIAFLSVAAYVGLKQGYAIQISTANILPILILGLLNTGTGCYFYFSSIGKLNVQTVAICGYLEPLSAVIFSIVLLKELMLPMQIAGTALIVGGAMLDEAARKRA